MYEEKYGVPYTFVPQNPNPYSSKECRDAWKLIVAFKKNIVDVRKYIYWLFKKQLSSNTNIISFNYINTPALVRKYVLYAEKKKALTRSSKLPESFLDWCHTNVPGLFEAYELSTMNDLGALCAYCKRFNDSASLEDERLAISRAEHQGLIKDGKLNIRG